jgi:hypothetical protein
MSNMNKFEVMMITNEGSCCCWGLETKGFFRLNEPSIQIRCRKEDLSMVNEAMKSAMASITTLNVFGVTPIMDLDKKNFLPSPPQVGFYGSTW